MPIPFTEEFPLSHLSETSIPDEEIRLRCLDYATRKPNYISDIDYAKQMYAWVKENSGNKNA